MLNNTSYGTIYFGVDDDGEILGINNNEISVDKIKEKVNKIEPKIIPDINVIPLNESKSYITVEANENNIPYSYDGRYYIRNFSSTERASNDTLRKMLLSSSPDYLTFKKSPNQLLTFNSLSAYLLLHNNYFNHNKETYKSYKLLDNQGDFNYLAYLLSDQNKISIRIYRYGGTAKTKMISMTDYGNKCIIESIDEILINLKGINTTAVNLDNKNRKEQDLFIFQCVREAVVNAFAHNNWLMESPTIFIFSDRLEIVSYGGLPFGLELKNFYNGESKPVNIALLDILIKCKFAEHSGHGIPTIIKHYDKNVFKIKTESVNVTLPYSFVIQGKITSSKQKIKKINKNQELVYEFLKKNGDLTIAELSKKSKLSESGIKKIIKALQDKNLLERVGSQKTGHWHTKI